MAATALPALAYDPGGGEIVINFTTPLEIDLFKFSTKANVRDAFTGSGKRQRLHNFNAKTKTLKFRFVIESNRDLVETMIDTWAMLGNSFKYIPDQNVLGTFFTVILMDKNWEGDKRENLGLNEFKFDLKVQQEI